MKRTVKRIVSILLCVAMLAGVMCNTALGASKTSGKCGKNAKWSYNKKNHTLTISGKGKMKNYSLGSGDYDTWLETNSPWESKKDDINRIVIKKGVTYIGELAFACCRATKVSIPKTVKKIGPSAFYGCEFQSVTIPEGVTSIGDYAFAESMDLKSIRIPKSVKKIGYMAIGYEWTTETVDDELIIYGYKGTAAEKYAKKNHIRFKRIK